ncbi:MAG: ABC transporter ATP-binding protein [Egibacteraceae bacterium]
MTDAMIQLEELTKRFPGQDEPAVEKLSMEIYDGEIVVLVGPSGCGKTTTMKLINRLIEPTSGRIVLEGEDVTKADPDQLRRRMGYVIQQIGLFPHMTIADNIAAVPRMLKWSDDRISKRVDELLDVVGMDPGRYRDRYPKELSGGQRQRVGVARGLAADPPVMLMDEPFGAIDPITRDRLQNEFLRLQEDIRKTIVFVTHDIDEAIKMGDRIAILRDRSIIAQYDRPEVILADPADEFVADFIGSGASLKRLALARVRDYELSEWPTGKEDEDPDALLDRLREADRGALLLLDNDDRPRRWLQARDLKRADGPLTERGLEVLTVAPTTTLADALNELVRSRVASAAVVDSDGSYRGTVDMSVITAAVEVQRNSAQESARADAKASADTKADDEHERAEA